MEPIQRTSEHINEKRYKVLKDTFPEIWSEGKINFDRLRETLGDFIDEGSERYTFQWAGKKDAIKMLQVPTQSTLVPSIDESVLFEETKNIFIEGDNLEVLKLLYTSYYKKIKMIYIDPPYNTGKDFIYPDNYRDPLKPYLKLIGDMDEDGNLLTSNPETSGRFHSLWLTMMYPRLFRARQLLQDDGVIFVSINDYEFHNLRMIMNEIFGEENFIGIFCWQSKKGGGSDKVGVVLDQEYVMCYSKVNDPNSLSQILIEAEELDREDEKGDYRVGRELNKWGSNSRREDRPTMWFPIPGPNGEEVYPIRNDGTEGCWRWGKEKMANIVKKGDVEFVKRKDGSYIVYEKIRNTDPRYKPFRTWLLDVGTTAEGSKTVKELFDGKRVYDYPKPVKLIKKLIGMGTTSDEDIVLDFFAGSCTTSHAVFEYCLENNADVRFICVQLPEPTPPNSIARNEGYDRITDIAKERIRRAGKKLRENLNYINVDVGFKVFQLSKSNYNEWEGIIEYKIDDYIEKMEENINKIKDDKNILNIIYEISLIEGFPLTLDIKIINYDMNNIYKISDEEKYILICLDDRLHLETVEQLSLNKDVKLICKDSSLTDDLAANLSLQCNLQTI